MPLLFRTFLYFCLIFKHSFFYFFNRKWYLICFLIVLITAYLLIIYFICSLYFEGFDGALARKLKQTSAFGAWVLIQHISILGFRMLCALYKATHEA